MGAENVHATGMNTLVRGRVVHLLRTSPVLGVFATTPVTTWIGHTWCRARVLPRNVSWGRITTHGDIPVCVSPRELRERVGDARYWHRGCSEGGLECAYFEYSRWVHDEEGVV